jgi:hypothetical protein
MVGKSVLAAVLFAFAASHANADIIYSVTLDTSGFDPAGNDYQMDVNLTAANGRGDASSVTLYNFVCPDCPTTPQTLVDSTFSQDMYIDFTAGGIVSFDLSISPDLTYLSADGPDSFQLSFLDQYSNVLTTTDPFDAVLFAALDSESPTVRAFASYGDGDTSFNAPTVHVVSPEPDSALLAVVAIFAAIAMNHRTTLLH